MAHMVCGSPDADFAEHLLDTTYQATNQAAPGDLPGHERNSRFNFEASAAFMPTDGVEGMIAAQAIAMHHMTMECSRRAMIPNQPAEIAHRMRKAAANASRTFVDLVDALARKRGKGLQVVRVERVVIHEGGQAIVGNINASSGRGAAGTKIERQPHVAALADGISTGALSPALRSQDAEWSTVPPAGHAERKVPKARRQKHGTPNA